MKTQSPLTLTIISVFSSMIFSMNGNAQVVRDEAAAPAPVAPVSHANSSTPNAAAATASKTLNDELSGLGFGPGVAAIYMFGDRAIDNASIDSNNVVRVQRQSRVRAGGIVEAHYLWNDPRFLNPALLQTVKQQAAIKSDDPNLRVRGDDGAATLSPQNYSISNVAYGVTFAVELGSDVVRSVGIGPMVSFRHFDVSVSDAQVKEIKPRGIAFNLALIGLVEPNVKTLSSGIVADKPLPAGTSIQFDQSQRFGAALLFSGSF